MTGLTRVSAPGAPCWAGLTAHHLETAAAFYGPLLGWRFESLRRGRSGSVLRAMSGDHMVAVIAEAARRRGPGVAWTAYFATEDAGKTADSVRERGGTVAVGPLDFDAGRLALVADPSGATFGLWQGERATPPEDEDLDRSPCALVWLHLHTWDAFDAAIFYGGVFRWDDSPAAEGAGGHRYDVAWEHECVVLRVDGRATAALSGDAGTGGRAGARPGWRVHFPVPDLDAALRTAVALGGRIATAPHESAHGRIAVVSDPEGGVFSLIQREG